MTPAKWWNSSIFMAEPREQEGRGRGGGRAEAGRRQGEGGRTGREVHVRGSSYARVDVYKLHGNKLLLVLKTYISTKWAAVASRRWSRQTGRTRERKGRQAARRNEAFLTILAIRVFGLPSGSLAQVLSWCGGRCETELGGSRSGGRGRDLWSVLVCLGCAETVTCWERAKAKVKEWSSRIRNSSHMYRGRKLSDLSSVTFTWPHG